MLQLTPQATRHLLKIRSERGVDASAGARFVSRNGHVGLTFAARPKDDDRVVEGDEIKIFVAPDIAATLDQSIIDARVDDGKESLVIRRQPGTKSAPSTAPKRSSKAAPKTASRS